MTALEALNSLKDALAENDGHELNMSNYNGDDVSGLNNAYIQLFGAIENAISALQSAREWMPVSSAPKDGTRILVTAADEKMPDIYPYIAYFNLQQDAWMSDDSYWIDFDQITHWQPLPPPTRAEG